MYLPEITLLSAALRIYNIQRLFRTRSSGIKLIAAGARTTSVEALKRIQDAENDPDLQLSLLSLNSLRQKVIITIAVAAPGMVKSAMMLLVSIVVAKHQGSGLTLLLAFGFSCLVFAINLQETLGWFHLRDTYRKEKQAADTKLASLGLRRPDGYHHRTQTEKDAVDYSDEESKAGGGGKRREIEAPGGETPSPVDGVATEKHIASHALEDEENP
ncbi:uncharacterized protein EV422DRAFT_154554 [Fimicolochytrium jonesii]|uniref:uncharacterized protein n=1 Tax=Fimicolochytrium jonesii TaxID=1396493 RepID=UPI0022FE24D2|nr:uncharacterized protein EV422DRAFT_154554 [Fimicolochytrium jonesii]KAI8826113.1 hypothetical protein EV422DRAFT_154554 [Fimicolochytrium jonesii]